MLERRYFHPRFAFIFLVCLLLAACGHNGGRGLEVVYVSAPQAILRDHMAAVYSKTGVVKNGDRLEVLERDRRFVKVRTAKNEEGWLEDRYVVSQQVYEGFQKLSQQEKNDPVQAAGTTRNDTNIHLTPGRETDHLFLLSEGAKVSILKRATVPKSNALAVVKPVVEAKGNGAVPPIPMEDWWLIRDPQGDVGWVLARLVDVDIPLDIAQYAEGQRIVACFVLDQVADGDKQVPQYLVVLSEPRDGMPFDYNQIRVFTWNVRKHRYETAYHERDLKGVLPVTMSQENFDKEGKLPVFILHVKDDQGNTIDRKYKFNPPIVRRVLAPGEEKPIATRLSRKRR